MPIVGVLNQKGGAGKTTFSCHFAVELSKRGYSVAIVDTDPQGNASSWRALRAPDDVLVVKVTDPRSIGSQSRALANKYDVVIIDGAAVAADPMVASVKVADSILIPCQPAPKDIWSTSDLVDLILARHQISGGLPPSAFIVNGAKKGTILGREIDDALLKLGLPVFDNRIHERELYKLVDKTGSVAQELEPGGDAAKEIQALVTEIIENKFLGELREAGAKT